jgi:acyl-CoA synthetase (AMP-forming)/AMP-acid ligase II
MCEKRVWCPYIKQDVNLGLLPMFHQYGCLIGLTTLSVGAKLIIVPKFSFVDMLNTIQEYRVIFHHIFKAD